MAKLRGISIREVLGVGDGPAAEPEATNGKAEEPVTPEAVAAESDDSTQATEARLSARGRGGGRGEVLMADIQLKQVRSANGASEVQRDTLRSLKLGRIGRESKHPDTPAAAGHDPHGQPPGRGRGWLSSQRRSACTP